MDVCASGHRLQRVGRWIDAAIPVWRTVRDGVAGVVVEANVIIADGVEQQNPVVRRVEQVVAAVARVFESDDYSQLFGMARQRLDVVEKTGGVAARCGVGIDHLGAEPRGKVHAATEDADRVVASEVDVRREGVAAQPAVGEPARVLLGLVGGEGALVERLRIADDERRLDVGDAAGGEAFQHLWKSVAVVRRGRDRDDSFDHVSGSACRR